MYFPISCTANSTTLIQAMHISKSSFGENITGLITKDRNKKTSHLLIALELVGITEITTSEEIIWLLGHIFLTIKKHFLYNYLHKNWKLKVWAT